MSKKIKHFDTGNKKASTMHVYALSPCGRMFQCGFKDDMKKITKDKKQVTCKTCLSKIQRSKHVR